MVALPSEPSLFPVPSLDLLLPVVQEVAICLSIRVASIFVFPEMPSLAIVKNSHVFHPMTLYDVSLSVSFMTKIL